MRYALAPILTGALIVTCATQPALAKPCTYPMTRLAAAQPQAPAAPRAKESRNPPCTILQRGTRAASDPAPALA